MVKGIVLWIVNYDGREGDYTYRYPDFFVQLLGYREYFHLPSRQTEGVVTAHTRKEIPSSIPDYSTIKHTRNSILKLMKNRNCYYHSLRQHRHQDCL